MRSEPKDIPPARPSEITHHGTISAVDDNRVTISIAPSSEECNKCAISSLCSRPTEIEVALQGASPALIGRRATVAYTSSTHRLATLLFLGAPLVLLLMALCIASFFGTSQLAAGIIAISVVCLWYLGLLSIRRHLQGENKFQIIHLW